jgi:hypothetical protein
VRILVMTIWLVCALADCWSPRGCVATGLQGEASLVNAIVPLGTREGHHPRREM